MDPFLHLTKHLILAAGKIDLKLPETKDIRVPSIMNTPFYESVLVKKEQLIQPLIRKVIEVPIPQMAVAPEIKAPQMFKAVPEVKIPKFSINPKLDSLMNDPEITSIQYEPLQPFKIKKGASVISTDIFLNEGEAQEIVKKFSEASNTPLSTVFRSKVGNHSISAIISPIAGIRFLILRI